MYIMPPKKATKVDTVINDDKEHTITKGKSKKTVSKTENNDSDVEEKPSIPTKGKAKKTVSKTETKNDDSDVEEKPSIPTKGKAKKTVSKTESKDNSPDIEEKLLIPTKGKAKKTNSKTESNDNNPDIEEKLPIPTKKTISKKETLKNNSIKEIVIEKPTKGGKKIINSNLDSDNQKNITEDDEKFKIWKHEWATIVAKIIEHQKVTHDLEKDRDELVKKMDSYITGKNGSSCENILELNPKLKKTITKFDVTDKPIDTDSDDDTSDDDTDDESDYDATPLEPIKTCKTSKPIFAPNSSSKKKLTNSDSDDSD